LTTLAALVTVAPKRETQQMGISTIARRLALAGAVAAAGAGCSADYIFATYSAPVGPTIVTVDCNVSYEVFENVKERKIMVRSSPGAELTDAICRADPALGPRPRRAVLAHFEKTKRTNCAIVEERRLSAIHWEYVLACT
jgi:hypothetical protein